MIRRAVLLAAGIVAAAVLVGLAVEWIADHPIVWALAVGLLVGFSIAALWRDWIGAATVYLGIEDDEIVDDWGES